MTTESRLLETTIRCLARYEAHSEGGPVLAAISGGRDSTLLAWLLATLQHTGRLSSPVRIGHVDHAIHEHSAEATVHVARLCDRLGLDFVCERLKDVPPTEEALRNARYEALVRMARSAGARVILTAHHADDNLETVLFRLVRGTGPRGLAGIPESRRLTDGVMVVRPLLEERAKTLHEALSTLDLPWFEDPTNRDLSYSRNRIRHELIPELRSSVGEHLDDSLLTLARQARKVTDILDVQAMRILSEEARFVTPWRCELDLDPDDDGRRIFLSEAVCQIHERLHPDHRRPRWSWIQRVLDLRGEHCGQRVHGIGDLLVERTRSGLLLSNLAGAGDAPDSPLELPEHGNLRFGTTEWTVRSTPRTDPPLSPSPSFPDRTESGKVSTGHAVIDPRGAPRPWRLRTRRPGDRFWPLGGRGPLDLRRFMQNRRVPRFDRSRLPLLVDAEDRLLWIPGVEIADPNRIQLDTEQCFELKLSIVGGDPSDLGSY
jgi:tRNA(Ile)-lysidine synthase